jgi:glycosyltransferase involved in cell wall biosynthesis
MSNPLKLSVILPAYNEADKLRTNLLEVLKTLDQAPERLAIRPFEVIVVDDGSQDETASIAREVGMLDARLKLVSYQPNRGKGAALKAGFECARGEWVAFLDADLDLHPNLLLAMFDIAHARDADVVIGSKQHPQSQVDYSFLRRAYSLGYYLLVRVLFGLPVHDTQTGIKLFKYEVLRDAFPRMTVRGYAYDLELLVLAHQHGALIVEAPVTVTSQRLSRRIGPRDVLIMLRDTINIWQRMHRQTNKVA